MIQQLFVQSFEYENRYVASSLAYKYATENKVFYCRITFDACIRNIHEWKRRDNIVLFELLKQIFE